MEGLPAHKATGALFGPDCFRNFEGDDRMTERPHVVIYFIELALTNVWFYECDSGMFESKAARSQMCRRTLIVYRDHNHAMVLE